MKLLQEFYASVRALLIAATSANLVVAQEAADPEEQAWQEAVSEGTAAAFQGYLESYPAGRYAEEAFACTIEVEESDVCTIVEGEGGSGAMREGVAVEVY